MPQPAPFRRQHFQTHFNLWKLFYLYPRPTKLLLLVVIVVGMVVVVVVVVWGWGGGGGGVGSWSGLGWWGGGGVWVEGLGWVWWWGFWINLVLLSARMSVCRRHGFWRATQVRVGIPCCGYGQKPIYLQWYHFQNGRCSHIGYFGL